jgi:hypothetical protein
LYVRLYLQAGNKKSSLYRLEKAAWAVLVVRLLRQLHFFPNRSADDTDGDPWGTDELLVCRLAEHFLRVADDNCHEVCQVDAPPANCASLADILATEDGTMDQVVVVVGVAIYLKSSLFNNR